MWPVELLLFGVGLLALAALGWFVWRPSRRLGVALLPTIFVLSLLGDAALRATDYRPTVPALPALALGVILLLGGVTLRLRRGVGVAPAVVAVGGLLALTIGAARVIRPV